MDELIPLWMVVSYGGAILLVVLLLGIIFHHHHIRKLRDSQARLQTLLEAERTSHQEKLAAYQQARDQLAQTFDSLAVQALRTNNETFLRLAEENLKQHHIQAQGELTQREKAVESMIKPIRESLEKTERELRRIEGDRQQSYGSLNKHLETMALTQQQLHTETRNLVKALRRPEVRGRWGELTLKRLVELSGMVEHCDFEEQKQGGIDQVVRPDMVVHLPAGRDIVVDVKTPLDAYLSALEADSDQDKQHHITRHAGVIRSRIRELAAKAYWKQFSQAPDFVILFIPGEQFLSAAMDADDSLFEYAIKNKIILTTPSSFVGVLRAVAFGWRQQQLNENTEHIREIGEQLYKRLCTFTDHLTRLGKALNQAAEMYNKSMGTLQRQVIPGARKFTELGISEHQNLQIGEEVETALRGTTGTDNASEQDPLP